MAFYINGYISNKSIMLLNIDIIVLKYVIWSDRNIDYLTINILLH